MTLPLLLSVPHGGLRVPPEASPYCVLTPEQIAADGDEGAAEIYSLEGEVRALHRTEIARAIVDLNRAEDDRRKDGVVKTHTCWDVPVYDPTPPEKIFRELLDRYYRPYHDRLSQLARDVPLGIDCHTMAAEGPPVGPDPGKLRPAACLGFGDGTCPREWVEALARALQEALGRDVTINDPFSGGFITRSRPGGIPWVQIELSRGPFLTNDEKRGAVLTALRRFSDAL